MFLKKISFFFILIFILACSTQPNKDVEVVDKKEVKLKHATNFGITTEGTHKIVTINKPHSNATTPLKYRLIPKKEKQENVRLTYKETIIYTPIDKFVCTSTTHLAPLEMLGSEDKLIGFPSTQYISSSSIREQVEQGKTIELGKDSDINIELLMNLSPELVMVYSLSGDYSKLSPITNAGISMVINAEFLEETPLGRAEWIKFMSVFFDREKEADSIFNAIEKNYLRLTDAVQALDDKPTIMSGVVYGDTWFVPGGKSWAAKFFNDAGGDFLWSDNETIGSLQLSFEAVYEKAQNASLWIGAANYYSLNELEEQDNRYSNFNAFKKGDVFTYNARAMVNGGNDYFESGFSRPDLVLNDLVKIIHPELETDHELFYFRKLNYR